VLLNIEDFQDQRSVQFRSPKGKSDLASIDRAIAMLTGPPLPLKTSRS